VNCSRATRFSSVALSTSPATNWAICPSWSLILVWAPDCVEAVVWDHEGGFGCLCELLARLIVSHDVASGSYVGVMLDFVQILTFVRSYESASSIDQGRRGHTGIWSPDGAVPAMTDGEDRVGGRRDGTKSQFTAG
jgi:hypothetical protein